MASRPGHFNAPANTTSWLISEARLLLLVVALTAGLAVAVSQLRAMVHGPAAALAAAQLDAVAVGVAGPEGLMAAGSVDAAPRSRPLMAAAAPAAKISAAADAADDAQVGEPVMGSAGAAAGGEGGERGHRSREAESSGGGGATSRPAQPSLDDSVGVSGPPAATPAPVVVLGIAHRGASAELPEHTREAYELAVAEGADFIECDVVLTADLVPLCRHEPNLVGSTDAATKFPDRWRTYNIDGEQQEGVFSVDLTAEEVASLRAVQPWPFRNQSYNGMFRVATLADYLQVATSAGRPVGIYPETKHPSWTNSLPAVRAANTSLEDILLAALAEAGFGAGAPLGSEAWRRRPVFLQSFEAGSLRYLAAASCAPTVLLLGDWEGWVAPDSGLSLQQLTEESSLEQIAVWAAAVGPAKSTLVSWQQQQQQQEQEQEEAESGSSGGRSDGVGVGRYVSSGLVERFH
ncbi:hypothetical protein PLESTM_000801600, partial [Pleodorina starrii]